MTTYFNSGFFQRPAGCLFQVPSTSGVNLLCLRTGVILNVSSDSLGVLTVATEAQIQQEALSTYLALEKKHEAEMTELKSRYIAALGGELKDLSSELEETLERSYKENQRLRDLVSRAPFTWDKFCILEGLIATEKDEDKRKEYALQYNRIGLEFDFEPCETEPRPRMSEERMRELLAEGRRVREAVEKDIAEMRDVSGRFVPGVATRDTDNTEIFAQLAFEMLARAADLIGRGGDSDPESAVIAEGHTRRAITALHDRIDYLERQVANRNADGNDS